MIDSGFKIIEKVVPSFACEALLSALCRDPVQRSRAGARHLMSHPDVLAMAQRAELLELARSVVGSGAIPYRATLFEKTGVRNWLVVWHQDTTLPLTCRVDAPGWGPWSTKESVLYTQAPAWALERIVALRIHLDPSTADNGPLRVIPGSHRWGVLSDEEVFRKAREHSARECIGGKGSVLVMKPLLIHASSKAEQAKPRRVLHLEYASSLELGEGVRLAIA